MLTKVVPVDEMFLFEVFSRTQILGRVNLALPCKHNDEKKKKRVRANHIVRAFNMFAFICRSRAR